MFVRIHDIFKNDLKPICTIDFENTLTLPKYNFGTQCWTNSLDPNKHTIAMVAKLLCDGWRCIIVSSKKDSMTNRSILTSFLTSSGLGKLGVIWTDGIAKETFIKAVGSTLHLDDDPAEIMALAGSNITGILISHPDDYLSDVSQDRLDKIRQQIISSSVTSQPTNNSHWASTALDDDDYNDESPIDNYSQWGYLDSICGLS